MCGTGKSKQFMGLRGTEPEQGPNSVTFWRRITLGDTGAQISLKAAYPHRGRSWALRPLLLSAITYRSPSARRSAGICALQTSEKAGNLIAKRPEREFSLGAAAAQISAKAVVGDLIQLLPQWIGYRTLAGKFP